ncbi:M18 family aminopeptidase [Lentisphaera marina]|uniref:M18 family aminopeptidase n=1 Tax=Lentisphaera marina TaxID=1111041 RepID=UPI002366F1CE|nr:M18 family aminopeptidase [Lentisphaera marina]MDD7984802.1 M18 family aminopeptidase [Lentisphaera marina]
MRDPQAEKLLTFIDACPSPFHAVAQAKEQLTSSGFIALNEDQEWDLKAGGAYFVERSGGSIIAFRIPEIHKEVKFHIVGAHTDSPCFKMKPNPSNGIANYYQWGAETYGGLLKNSWLDRDLHLSGRLTLIINGEMTTKLVSLDSYQFRIPQLAIHLDDNREALKLNPQQHLTPIFGLEKDKDLLQIILDDNNIEATSMEVAAFDLFLHDSQKSAFGGLNDEFIYAPRLDNLAMCHASLEALIASKPRSAVTMGALFDHEEVGSVSDRGACSSFLPAILERISLSLKGEREAYLAALSRSYMLSADMAHAVHPNYSERHDRDHYPLINHGPVIKHNANQRYATNSETAAYFSLLCQESGITVQEFVSRNDCPCGSTIGPSVASKLGIKTVDVGNPMLSMHSIREMAGSKDHAKMICVFEEFFSK